MEKIKNIGREKAQAELRALFYTIRRKNPIFGEIIISNSDFHMNDYLESLWRNMLELASKIYPERSGRSKSECRTYGNRRYYIQKASTGYFAYPSISDPVFVKHLPESFDSLVAAFEEAVAEAEEDYSLVQTEVVAACRADNIALITCMEKTQDILDEHGLKLTVMVSTDNVFSCSVDRQYYVEGLPLEFNSSASTIREDLMRILEENKEILTKSEDDI